MGRPAKTLDFKVISGGSRQRKQKAQSPLASASLPPPEELGPAARQVWIAKLPMLVADRLLASIDLGLFAAYCEAEGTWREETAAIAVEGATVSGPHGPVMSPRAKVRSDAFARMMRAATVLGIGQINRQRLTPLPEVTDDTEEQFFARSG